MVWRAIFYWVHLGDRRRCDRCEDFNRAAQMGERHSSMAKTPKGFGGATVIEVKESFDGNAHRAVYTVRDADAVYVLHAFQKKSKRGSATPKAEIDLIKKNA